MKTPKELVSKMLSEMPIVLNAKVLPYLFELAELAQTEAWNEAIEKNKDLLSEAILIIENLMAYGRIHTVTGVRYVEGTHKEMIDKANIWLNDISEINNQS